MTLLRPHRLTGTGRWRRGVLHVECGQEDVAQLAGLVDEFHPKLDVLGVAWRAVAGSPRAAVRAQLTVQVHQRDIGRLEELLRARLGPLGTPVWA